MSRFRQIVPQDAEIDAVLNKAYDGLASDSIYPCMSYEEGVIAAMVWLFGDNEIDPFEDEQ